MTSLARISPSASLTSLLQWPESSKNRFGSETAASTMCQTAVICRGLCILLQDQDQCQIESRPELDTVEGWIWARVTSVCAELVSIEHEGAHWHAGDYMLHAYGRVIGALSRVRFESLSARHRV